MEEYEQWLKKAVDDLNWTKSNIDSGIWYGACFTAQQSVEKAYKSAERIIKHVKKIISSQ